MIEDDFKPETVNEVLLLNRIRELQRVCWESGSLDLKPRYTIDSPIQVDRIQPTLVLAAELKAGWESDHSYGISMRAVTRPSELHFAYFLSKEVLTHWSRKAAAQHLGNMHKKCIHSLAEAIINEERSAEAMRKARF